MCSIFMFNLDPWQINRGADGHAAMCQAAHQACVMPGAHGPLKHSGALRQRLCNTQSCVSRWQDHQRSTCAATAAAHLQGMRVNVSSQTSLGQRPCRPQGLGQLLGCQVTITIHVQGREGFLQPAKDVLSAKMLQPLQETHTQVGGTGVYGLDDCPYTCTQDSIAATCKAAQQAAATQHYTSRQDLHYTALSAVQHSTALSLSP